MRPGDNIGGVHFVLWLGRVIDHALPYYVAVAPKGSLTAIWAAAEIRRREALS